MDVVLIGNASGTNVWGGMNREQTESKDSIPWPAPPHVPWSTTPYRSTSWLFTVFAHS